MKRRDCHIQYATMPVLNQIKMQHKCPELHLIQEKKNTLQARVYAHQPQLQFREGKASVQDHTDNSGGLRGQKCGITDLAWQVIHSESLSLKEKKITWKKTVPRTITKATLKNFCMVVTASSLLHRLMLNLKLQYFGHLPRRADLFEKTLMLGKIEVQRRRDWQRMRQLDSTTNSIDMNLNKLWEMVKDREPGLLQSVGLQRFGHNLETEQQYYYSYFRKLQKAEFYP